MIFARRLAIGCVALVALFAGPAQAADWGLVTKVTNIEVTYVPDNLLFKIEQQAGSCSPGTALKWNIRGADQTAKNQNMQAALAALMSAEIAGKTVTIFGNNADCSVDYLYVNA